MLGCSENCMCQNEALCHHVNGNCSCLPGWEGLLCENPCADGFYGDGCAGSCQCENGARCDKATGMVFCIKTIIIVSCSCQVFFQLEMCGTLSTASEAT